MTSRTDAKADLIVKELGPSNNVRFAAMCDFARGLEEELDKRTELNQNQIHFATKCMAKWINLLEDNKRGTPSAADVDHSALLYRLLSGKEPHKVPPPTTHSYPDYGLAEGVETVVISISNHPAIGLSINQGRGWVPETQLNQDFTGVVIHEPSGGRYELYNGHYEANTRQPDNTWAMQKHPSLMIKRIGEFSV